jgi:hypothetical protein
MIYIVSGASRSGKSIVTKRLLEEHNLPFLPVDSVMIGFMHGVKDSGVHDKMWPDEIAVKLWPFLKTFIISLIHSNMAYVLDGEAFLPGDVAQLMMEYPNQIRAVFMGYTDVSTHDKLMDIKIFKSENDWFNKEDDSYIIDHIQNMLLYSAKIKNECKKYNMNYVDTSHQFDDKINEVINQLLYIGGDSFEC